MSAVQIVDDSDPVVSYSSGWQKSGGSNEYNATTSWANQPGTTATIVFLGVQISVVGTIGPRTAGIVSPQSNYTVDGGNTNVYTATQDSTVHYSTRFYLSPVLPNGQHTLIVTNVLDSDSFFIDYFLIFKSPNDTSFSPNVVTVTLTSTPTSTSQSSRSTGPSTANTGTIVGAALGAAVLVVLAVALILWLRSRNKRDTDEANISSHRDEQEFGVTPTMVYTPPPSDTPRTSQPILSFVSTSSDAAQLSPQPQSSTQTQDPLPPPPRYTLDFSQPLIPVRGPSTENMRASGHEVMREEYMARQGSKERQ